MRSGRMRHRVTLRRRVDSQAGSGQVVHSYEAFAINVPAEINPITASEYFSAQQINAGTTSKIRIRFRQDIDETCQVMRVVKHDSPQIVELWDIEGILPDAKTGRTELLLMVSKNEAEGWRA